MRQFKLTHYRLSRSSQSPIDPQRPDRRARPGRPARPDTGIEHRFGSPTGYELVHVLPLIECITALQLRASVWSPEATSAQSASV